MLIWYNNSEVFNNSAKQKGHTTNSKCEPLQQKKKANVQRLLASTSKQTNSTWYDIQLPDNYGSIQIQHTMAHFKVKRTGILVRIRRFLSWGGQRTKWEGSSKWCVSYLRILNPRTARVSKKTNHTSVMANPRYTVGWSNPQPRRVDGEKRRGNAIRTVSTLSYPLFPTLLSPLALHSFTPFCLPLSAMDLMAFTPNDVGSIYSNIWINILAPSRGRMSPGGTQKESISWWTLAGKHNTKNYMWLIIMLTAKQDEDKEHSADQLRRLLLVRC